MKHKHTNDCYKYCSLYNDFAPRNGSNYDEGLEPLPLTERIAATFIFALLVTLMIALVGSIIWGGVGFVELLASFF